MQSLLAEADMVSARVDIREFIYWQLWKVLGIMDEVYMMGISFGAWPPVGPQQAIFRKRHLSQALRDE